MFVPVAVSLLSKVQAAWCFTCSGVLGAEGAGLSAVCTCSGIFGAEGAILLFGKAD